MAIILSDLLKMSQSQLDELFSQSPAGEIPEGEAKGTAIVAPGTTYTEDLAEFISHFAWQGKVFDSSKAYCETRSCFSASAQSWRGFTRNSWFDQKECIV
jgi:hypothetical protein